MMPNVQLPAMQPMPNEPFPMMPNVQLPAMQPMPNEQLPMAPNVQLPATQPMPNEQLPMMSNEQIPTKKDTVQDDSSSPHYEEAPMMPSAQLPTMQSIMPYGGHGHIGTGCGACRMPGGYPSATANIMNPYTYSPMMPAHPHIMAPSYGSAYAPYGCYPQMTMPTQIYKDSCGCQDSSSASSSSHC
jgi:morphogenetic protein associated with SpoVID